MAEGPTSVSVAVRNLGGIEEREVTFDGGVTVLAGRNATNRTSLLQSIAAALGGSAGELKSDADEGVVELTVDGETYVRRFERRDGDVVATGDPVTDETALVDQFCCLLADNPARRAVERGDGAALREIVMAPVDTDELRREISATRRDLREVDERIEEIERRRSNLPAMEERRQNLEADLSDVENELDDVRAALEDADAAAEPGEHDDAPAAGADGRPGGDGNGKPGDDGDGVVAELTAVREEYESAGDRLSTQRNAIDSLEEERERVDEQLSDASPPADDLAAVEAELERRRRRERDLASVVADLEAIVEFNEGLLEGERGLPTDADDGGDDVLGELDPATATVECWTCGTTVERGDVADRLDGLRSVLQEKRAERASVREEIDEAENRLAELRDAVDEYEALEATAEEVDEELAERTERVAELEARERDLRDRIDELEAAATAAEDARDEAVLEQYQRLSELEYERGQLEEQLAGLADEIADVEALGDELSEREAERDELRERLAALRSRIEDLERSAVETFNEHVAAVVDRLGYENVERVWIERRTDGDGQGPDPESTFTLHVVRTGEDGAVYEDTVDHLSESEREVVGLVVALAGYLVHDVHDRVPIVLLDSLESIDADRIAALVEYFADYAPVLLAALLPEDATALPDRYDRREMGEALAR